MSIQEVKAASAVWRCIVCGSQSDTAWASWTIGNVDGESVRTISPGNCAVCGAIIGYVVPETQRLTLAHLAIAEVLNLAKTAATYTGVLTAADVTTALGSYDKLSTHVAIPFTVGDNGGKLYHASAIKEALPAALLEYCKHGAVFYGTDAEVAGYINLLTTDSHLRAMIRKNHDLE